MNGTQLRPEQDTRVPASHLTALPFGENETVTKTVAEDIVESRQFRDY